MKVTLAFPVIKKLKIEIEIALLPQRKPSSGQRGNNKKSRRRKPAVGVYYVYE
jgi:hypothetical protein